MAEYIEREAAVNLILETPFTMSMCLSEQECHGMNRAKQIFARLVEQSIPAADVRENVKSKWEDVEITMITEDNAPSEIVSMFCPNCKRYHNEVYHYGNPIENANFCPNCGADMKGGNDG